MSSTQQKVYEKSELVVGKLSACGIDFKNGTFNGYENSKIHLAVIPKLADVNTGKVNIPFIDYLLSKNEYGITKVDPIVEKVAKTFMPELKGRYLYCLPCNNKKSKNEHESYVLYTQYEPYWYDGKEHLLVEGYVYVTGNDWYSLVKVKGRYDPGEDKYEFSVPGDYVYIQKTGNFYEILKKDKTDIFYKMTDIEIKSFYTYYDREGILTILPIHAYDAGYKFDDQLEKLFSASCKKIRELLLNWGKANLTCFDSTGSDAELSVVVSEWLFPSTHCMYTVCRGLARAYLKSDRHTTRTCYEKLVAHGGKIYELPVKIEKLQDGSVQLSTEYRNFKHTLKVYTGNEKKSSKDVPCEYICAGKYSSIKFDGIIRLKNSEFEFLKITKHIEGICTTHTTPDEINITTPGGLVLKARMFSFDLDYPFILKIGDIAQIKYSWVAVQQIIRGTPTYPDEMTILKNTDTREVLAELLKDEILQQVVEKDTNSIGNVDYAL